MDDWQKNQDEWATVYNDILGDMLSGDSDRRELALRKLQATAIHLYCAIAGVPSPFAKKEDTELKP